MNEKFHELLNITNKYINKSSNPNIGVAIIDTGVFPHQDISNNIIDFYDCINNRITPYDNNGHGTHVSGIVAGTGKGNKEGIRGINPNAKIIGIKALNQKGSGKVEYVLKGLRYVIKNKEKFNIRIVNISIGGSDDYLDAENIALINGVEEVWKSGIVVVCAAGNNGPDKRTITAPGVSRKIITVGCLDDILINRESNAYNKKNKYSYSGRGPTCYCIIKPDIVCTGNLIPSLANNYTGYTKKSGTSMATPIVSAAISLLLEKKRTLYQRT